MRMLFLILLFTSGAWAQSNSELQKLLDLDRFQTYVTAWGETMKGRGKVEIAEAMMRIPASELARMNLSATKLSDAMKYDELILEVLQKKRPKLNAKLVDVEWGYNFYKRKLNDAFLVTPLKPSTVTVSPGGLQLDEFPAVTPQIKGDILLDVDRYVADRTTRAVFWEASQSQRAIELHVGTAGSFKDHILAKGGKVLSEIRTHARNYNPIYLVQYPGEKNYRYAITEIAGEDRVKHLAMQSDLIRWENATGKLAPRPPVTVVGDVASKLAAEKVTLKKVLEVLPKADHVLIGQKGAFERTVGSLSKAKALVALEKSHPGALSKLSDPQLKLLQKIKSKDINLTELVMKEASSLDDLYEAALPAFEKFKFPQANSGTIFNLNRGSYEMSDYLLEGANGKVQRWRVFSNVWGDEVIPVAGALKDTGHKHVVYMGTAGALPDSGLKVGDLVVPQKAMSSAGETFKLSTTHVPQGSKQIGTVINVSSPFEETTEWLKKVKGKAQAVEVETSHIGRIFNGPGDKVETYLLISDVVGSEGETLASASSSARRKAQINSFVSIFDSAGVSNTAPLQSIKGLEAWLEELQPNRDAASKYQVIREAQQRGLSTKAELKKLLEELPSFTTAKLEKSLALSDESFWKLSDAIEESGFSPKWSVSRSFAEGRWSPTQAPELHLQVSTIKAESELKALVSKLTETDPKLAKSLKINISRTNPGTDWVKFAKIPDDGLWGVYFDGALGFGGLAPTETSSGALKLVKVAPSVNGKASGTIAFFEPNTETVKLLEQLQGSEDARKILQQEIETINSIGQTKKRWKINLQVVDDLPGGKLAQISPVFSKADNLSIQLLITKKGIANPAVVMEEMIHLQQITGVEVPWKGGVELKSFVHPYHWAEVVANAKAGSPQAIEKLARLELEASKISRDAVAYYQERGMFNVDKSVVEEYLRVRGEHTEELYSQVSKIARQDLKAKNAKWLRSKEIFSKLEANRVKLDDLVAKGDRKGVKNLIDAYLPWEIMEPSEQKAWKEWLSAIEKPNPSKAKLVFRGMDGDFIMRTPDGAPYMMSTVLAKNQGNYTRRLRSLATMRERFGMKGYQLMPSGYELSGVKNPGSIATLMQNHSRDPMGSPFISTSNYYSASNFGYKKMGAFKLDERRLILNGVTMDNFLGEYERLTPLIVFPDEVVYVHDYGKNPLPAEWYDNQKHFIKNVEEKLGRKVTQLELYGHKSEQRFVKEGFEEVKEMFMDPEKLPTVSCGLGAKSCDCLYKGLNALLK